MFNYALLGSVTEELISFDDFSAVLDALTSQINAQTIMAVIGGAIGVSVGLAFMWWGARKLVHMLMAAFKKGKVSI